MIVALAPLRLLPRRAGRSRRPRWRFALPLLAVTLLVGTLGVATYLHLRDGIRADTQRTLIVIAEQKRQQIENLVAQTRIDADLYFCGSSQLGMLLRQWLDGGRRDAALMARIRARMAEVTRVRGWGGLALVDAAGLPLFDLGAADLQSHRAAIEDVLHEPRIAPIDLHRNARGIMEYGVLAPIGWPESAPLGVAYLIRQADEALNPLVESWPVPTRTAETYLVRRKGEEVQYLTPLRDAQDRPPGRSVSLRSPRLDAALAAQGQRGILEDAVDYRGNPVLAYATAVAGTPWLMIAKIDRREAYAEVRTTAWITALVAGLALLLLHTAGYLLWRRYSRRLELAALRARRAGEARFRAVFEQAPLGVALIDSCSGRILEANPRFADIAGRTPEDLTALDWMDFVHPDDLPDLIDNTARLNAGEIAGFCTNRRCLRPDGSTIRVGMTVAPVGIDHGEGPRHLCMIEDITERLRQEEALLAAREAEARYASEQWITAFAEQGLVGLVEADLQARLLRVNDRFCEIVGYPREALIGRPWMELTDPEDQAQDTSMADRLLNEGQPFVFEKRYRRKSGDGVWVTVAAALIRDRSGAPHNTVALVLDITERKLAEERLRLAIDAADLGIWHWDLATGKVVWSQRCKVHMGLPPGEEPSVERFLSALHPDDREHVEQLLGRALETREDYAAEYRIVRPNGAQRWIGMRGRVYCSADSVAERMGGITLDITERKRIEEALRELNVNLERKVEERTAEARAANAAKSEFLAHMSHEIRTPLSSVLGLAEILSRESLGAGQRDMVERIRLAGESLLAIVDEVLDLSKIEAGQLRIEPGPFDLRALLARLERLMGETANAKGLALRIEAPQASLGALKGDVQRLEQVLVNLTGNALKFTDRGEVAIAVEAREIGETAVRLRFTVRDTGIGIAPEALERLFAPFAQADADIGRRYGGTGLGLSICKRLVELMGGTIGAQSRIGEGSAFWFELPLARAGEGGAQAISALPIGPPLPPPAGPRLAGAHFLVVDDSAMNRDLIERALALEGATATLAADAEHALAQLRSRPEAFDAVLMDIRMPTMDGLTATRLIRTELGLTGLPVIALTAGVLAQEQAAARAAGVDDILGKPLELERMATLLARWVKSGPAVAIAATQPAQLPPSALRPADALPDIAGIDRTRAARTLCRDPDFFLRMLEELAGEFADVPERTRLDLARGKRAAAARRLHLLRGNAGMLGAVELMESAGGLEAAIDAGETDLDARLAALGAQLAALIAASAPWRGPASSGSIAA